MTKIIAFVLFAVFAPACLAGDTSTEWAFTEPVDEPESEPASDETCSFSADEDWEPQEFPFVVYQYLACTRDGTENILFSPAAIEIALAEIAEDLDGPDGQSIAESMGFDSPHEFAEHARQYRQALLERRPTDVRPEMTERGYADLDSYFIDEDDPEVLLEALGVEFYSVDCDDDSDSCQWSPQNDRWEQSFLLNEVLSSYADDQITRGFVLRGQWFLIQRSRDLTMDFDIDNERTISTPQFRLRTHAAGKVNDTRVLVSKFIGEEIGLITIFDHTRTLAELESSFSLSTLHQWLESLYESVSYFGPHIYLPGFDLHDTVEISELFMPSTEVKSTTRFSSTYEGVNFPIPIEPRHTPTTGGIPAIDVISPIYRLDKPFLFLIYDYPTESILMMGRITDPS